MSAHLPLVEARMSPRRMWALVAVLVTVTGGLFATAAGGAWALSATRGFVAAEGVYVWSRKEAEYRLERYLTQPNADDWEAFQRALAVPLADEVVRTEINAPHPDRARVRAAMLQGQADPRDIDDMYTFYRLARRLPAIERATGIWAEADTVIAQMNALGQRAHAHVLAQGADGVGAVSDPFLADARGELLSLSLHLDTLALAFARAFGDAARQGRDMVLYTTGAAALLLLALGFLATERLLRGQRQIDLAFRSILDHAHDLIAVIDADGKVLYANPAATRVIGRDLAQIRGHNVSEFVTAVAGDVSRGAPREAGDGETPAQGAPVEARVVTASGAERTVAATVDHFANRGGPPLLVVNARDVTDQRALEAQVAESRRMESVGRLAGGVAHDFNNMLTAILSSAEIAELKLRGGEDPTSELRQITTASERAAALVRRLLTFARRQPFEPRTICVNDLIAETEPLLRRLVDARIALSLDLPEEAIYIRGDRAQLEQSLVNVVANARDAIVARPDAKARGGHISIRARAEPSPGLADARTNDANLVAGEAAERSALLVIEDDGVGMSEDVRARAFDPFFTTKPPGQGTGLGLPGVYGVVQQHGGSVVIDSAPNEGTRLTMRLPVVRAPAAPERPSRAPSAAVRLDATVLVVEDEPAVRAVVARTLASAGARVVEAAEGAAAAEILSGANDAATRSIDVVLTDVVMPMMGGRELMDAVRDRHPELSFIFMSGYHDDPALDRRTLDGAVAFLPKPFSAEALLDAVRAATSRR